MSSLQRLKHGWPQVHPAAKSEPIGRTGHTTLPSLVTSPRRALAAVPRANPLQAALQPPLIMPDRQFLRDLRDALQGQVVLLMGYPGSGKGTQGKLLAAALATEQGAPYPHLSTGELFRAEARSGSAVGKDMQAALDAGVPVANDVVFPYLRRVFGSPDLRHGFILDGFPKNVRKNLCPTPKLSSNLRR